MWPLDSPSDGMLELFVSRGLAGASWILAGFLVNRLLGRIVWNGLLKRDGRPVVAKVVRDLSSAAVYLLCTAAMFHFVFQVNVATITVTSGFLAILLGYSAQNSLADVFAGVGLNVARQFQTGDWIEIDEHFGVVVEMNWRFVALETLYHNVLTIPNSVVAQAKVINYHRPYHHRGVILPVLVEGGARPDEVRRILVQCAAACETVEQDPEPEAALSEFQDNGVLYELWYYTREPDDWDIRNEILSMVWERFAEEGIGISLSEVRVKEEPPRPSANLYSMRDPARRLASGHP